MEVIDKPFQIFKPLLAFFEKRLSLIRPVRVANDRIYKKKFTSIHSDKFDHNIFSHLCEMGLAIRESGNLYLVEERSANDLMKFLAGVVGAKLNLLPTTNALDRYYSFKRMKQTQKRETILKDIIPFPSQIELKKLRKFKTKHRTLLLAFKNKIEQLVHDENIKEGTELFQETINELKFRKVELVAKMNESKFEDIFFGTVCGLLGGSITALTVDSYTGFALGVPSFANAVHSALKIAKEEDVFDQSGLKYLALVDKRLRISPRKFNSGKILKP